MLKPPPNSHTAAVITKIFSHAEEQHVCSLLEKAVVPSMTRWHVGGHIDTSQYSMQLEFTVYAPLHMSVVLQNVICQIVKFIFKPLLYKVCFFSLFNHIV